MKRIILSIAASVAVAATAGAQTGRLFGMESFPVTAMMDFARYDYSLNTPRSAAMGGAFGSLGADLSSMSINPAGLAMYRRSELGITTSVVTNNMIPTSGAGFDYRGDGLRGRYVLNNFGIAMNTYQGSGDVTSVQFGFGYNRLADLNYNYSYATPIDNSTVGDYLPNLIEGTPAAWMPRPSSGINVNPYADARIDPAQWPGVLAYRTEMLDNPANNSYLAQQIDPNSDVTHYTEYQSGGYVGEYTFSGAVNFGNKLYMGMTVSLLSIDNNRYLYYEETYPGNIYVQDFMLYNQWSRYTGAGVGLKFGLIYRPIESLRIGVAFHTPHWVSLSRSYRADMTTQFSDLVSQPYDWTDLLRDDYSYSTPPRLMGSVSYTIGQAAIISFDYERVWWNGMRSQNTRWDMLRDFVTNDFKGQDNFRLGAEYRPSPALALRAGGTYSGSVLKDKGAMVDVLDGPVANRSASASLGIGYRFANCSLDATYVYNKTSYTNYAMYDYQPSIKLYNNRNIFMLGFSARF